MENNPRYVIGTWDECEAIKIFYNTFISAKVGLVNMIQAVAMKVGNINVDVVTDALLTISGVVVLLLDVYYYHCQ